MPVTAEQTGNYIGYTMGADNIGFPTLYFENGHITQKHEKIDNVGWHPHNNFKLYFTFKKNVPNLVCVRSNVSYNKLTKELDLEIVHNNAHSSISFTKDYISDLIKKYPRFLKKVENHKVKTFLFEFFFFDGENRLALNHASRSSLVKYGDKSKFDMRYGLMYARLICHQSKLAGDVKEKLPEEIRKNIV
jgi:hypothetical protein